MEQFEALQDAEREALMVLAPRGWLISPSLVAAQLARIGTSHKSEVDPKPTSTDLI